MAAELPARGPGTLRGPWGRWSRGLAGALWEYMPAVVLLVALVGLWELLVQVLDTRPYILPAPSAIGEVFIEEGHLFPAHIRTTAVEALAGIAAAAAGGVALAVLIASVPLARRVLYPIAVTSQTIPMIVLAPMLVVWLGLGIEPKVTVVGLVCFFPIVVSTVDGLASADREMLALVRSMGASRLEELRHVLIPAAVPSFFAGLKIAAAYAVIAAIFGEWVGAQSGLGIFIIRSRSSYQTDQIFAAIVVIAVLSIALFVTVHLLARMASPWKYTNTNNTNNANSEGEKRS